MDTVTYPQKDVVDFINDYLIPLRVEVSKKSYFEKYHMIWTPTLLLLDYTGNEVQRFIGFMDKDEFIAFMHLGAAKVHFSIGEYDAANVHFGRLFEFFPKSNAVPEATYFQGVNLYKKSNDASELKRAYEKLNEKYPKSSWAKRSAPYRLL